jgi:glutamate racemase
MIGVFDSGYGGLNILKSLFRRLPQYDYFYLGDNARAPYGARSFEVIYQFTLQGVKQLFDCGCPLVLLACNTASARALRTLQQQFLPSHFPDRRLLGVVRPSAEALARIPVGDVSNRQRPELTGRVAILGTRETIRSQSYVFELQKLAPNLEVWQHECPIWAALVEAGEVASAGAEWFVQQYLHQLFNRCGKIDRILLACTHYAALLPLIQKCLPEGLDVLTQAELVEERLVDWLERHPELETRLLKTGTRRFFTTDDHLHFCQVAHDILGVEIECETMEIDRDVRAVSANYLQCASRK